MTELSTDRLRLEPAASSHATGLFPLFDNWKVARWLSGPEWPQSPGLFDAWLQRTMAANAEGREATFVLLHDSRPIGVVGVNQRRGARNLGYWLGEPYWNRGFMSEAAATLLRWFFAAPDHYFIVSGAIEGNGPSLRIQRRLGFIEVGESGVKSRPLDRRLPHIDTLLGRERWQAIISRSEL